MKVVIRDQLRAWHRFTSQRGMFVMLSWSEGVASCFLKSGQGPASPGKACGVERDCNVSCVDAVRGCTDPVAGTCCRSHLQNDHGLDCLGPIRARRAGVMGRVVWTSRFRGPGMATKGMLGGTPTPAGS